MPYVFEHEALLKVSGIKCENIDAFRKSCLQLSQTLCEAVMREERSYLEGGLHEMINSGIGCLAQLHIRNDCLYKPQLLLNDDERSLSMLKAYNVVERALDTDSGRDAMSVLLHRCLLGNGKGISSIFRTRAYHLEMHELKCQSCQCKLSHDHIRLGVFKFDEEGGAMYCEGCSVPVPKREVEFETLAIDSIARSAVLMKQAVILKKTIDDARKEHEKLQDKMTRMEVLIKEQANHINLCEMSKKSPKKKNPKNLQKATQEA